ncbi:exo-alpha-sialidase [Candidatus Poribacteria bacterium]
MTGQISARTMKGMVMQKPDCVNYEVKLESIHSGFDGNKCWVHARAGAIPGAASGGMPIVVLTMQELLLSASDVFYALNEMRTDDLGVSWSDPKEHSTLGRRRLENGVEVCICDYTPKWHKATGKLLGTGHLAHYVGDSLMPGLRPRRTGYSIYDPETRTWTPWDTLEMPDPDKFFSAGAGSTQRVDLQDGTILLPIYFRGSKNGDSRNSKTTIVHCSFDGAKLQYIEHGDELTVEQPRGFGEPSLTFYNNQYFLTIRNDKRGYVTSGEDGLHFRPHLPWTFDDGSELGSYNTQQHWVTHSDALFLVYTRRGANNDHVFRHRAPLFIAQVDPDRLCVIRSTERILVPERGARLGNFGVTEVDENQTWIIVTEWMQPAGCEKYGSDNSVFVARLLWDRPDRRP